MWSVIPINKFSDSLSRLSPILDIDERVKLTKNLGRRLINILSEIDKIEKIIIFTPEIEWAKIFQEKNILVLEDTSNKSLREKMNHVADWAQEMGANRFQYLSIDLPLASKEDIVEVMNAHDEGLTIVKASKDGGTNTLICDLPRPINFQFGKDSFRKHLKDAKLNKLIINTPKIEGLSFDLDDQDDWEYFLKKYQPNKNPLII